MNFDEDELPPLLVDIESRSVEQLEEEGTPVVKVPITIVTGKNEWTKNIQDS